MWVKSKSNWRTGADTQPLYYSLPLGDIRQVWQGRWQYSLAD